MSTLFSPKQVARAINVSESSLKRWCDRGLLPTVRTAGGHRRLPLHGVMEFLRSTQREVVHPELLGLPATSGQTHRVVDRGREQFREALMAGDEQRCRQVLFDLFLARQPISAICDDVIAESFRDIGDRWQCGQLEVYQERRACEICARSIYQLRTALPMPATDAPLAIGGAAADDRYHLPTTMVELVLRDNRWRAVSLGFALPFPTLEAAIRDHAPQLFWLSVSHLNDEEAFVRDYNDFYDRVGRQTMVVIGGRGLHDDLRHRLRYSAFCDNLRNLESFLQSLPQTPRPKAPPELADAGDHHASESDEDNDWSDHEEPQA